MNKETIFMADRKNKTRTDLVSRTGLFAFLLVSLLLVSVAMSSQVVEKRTFYYPSMHTHFKDHGYDLLLQEGLLTDVSIKLDPHISAMDPSKVIKGDPNNLGSGAEICANTPLWVNIGPQLEWAVNTYASSYNPEDKRPLFVWNVQITTKLPKYSIGDIKYGNKIAVNNEVYDIIRYKGLTELYNRYYVSPPSGKDGYLPLVYKNWRQLPWVIEPLKYIILDSDNQYPSIPKVGYYTAVPNSGYMIMVCKGDYAVKSNGKALYSGDLEDVPQAASVIANDVYNKDTNTISLSENVDLTKCMVILHQPGLNGDLAANSVEQVLSTYKKNPSENLDFSFKPVSAETQLSLKNVKVVDPQPGLHIDAFMMVDQNGKFDLVNDSFPISNGIKKERLLMKFKNTGDVSLKVKDVKYYVLIGSDGSGINLIDAYSDFNKKQLNDLESEVIKPGQSAYLTLDLNPARQNLGNKVKVEIKTDAVSPVCNENNEHPTFVFRYPVKFMNKLVGCEIKPKQQNIILGQDSNKLRYDAWCLYEGASFSVPCDDRAYVKYELKPSCTAGVQNCEPTYTYDTINRGHTLLVNVNSAGSANIHMLVYEVGNRAECNGGFNAVSLENISYHPSNPFLPPNGIYMPTSNSSSSLVSCEFDPSSIILHHKIPHDSKNVSVTCTYVSRDSFGQLHYYKGPCLKSYIKQDILSYPPNTFIVRAAANDTAYGDVSITEQKLTDHPVQIEDTMYLNDGSTIKCSLNVSVVQYKFPSDMHISKCKLDPSSVVINMADSDTATPRLLCAYESDKMNNIGRNNGRNNPQKRNIIYTDCYGQLIKDIRVTKDIPDYELGTTLLHTSSIYGNVFYGIRMKGKASCSGNVNIYIQGTDGKITQCSSDVYVIPYELPDNAHITGCKLDPSTLNINMNSGTAASSKLLCSYQINGLPTGRKPTYTDCYAKLINHIGVTKDVPDTSFTANLVNKRTGYGVVFDSVYVDAKSPSKGNVQVHIVDKDGKRFTCGASVNANPGPFPGLDNVTLTSCALVPHDISMYVGNTSYMNLMCTYTDVNTHNIYVGPCYKSSEVVGTVTKAYPPWGDVKLALVANATQYEGLRLDAINPSYNWVGVMFQKSDGKQVICTGTVSINVYNGNNTNSTGNNTSGGSAGGTGGGVQKTPSGFWCTVKGSNNVYTDSQGIYKVVCYLGNTPVDCSEKTNKVVWIRPNNQEVSGAIQKVIFGNRPGTVKLQASWDSPEGTISCGSIHIQVRAPTCFKFL